MPVNAPLDPFTRRRLIDFISNFRARLGQLPTARDLEENGFIDEVVRSGLHEKVLAERYVTLTNGMIVKGYVLAD